MNEKPFTVTEEKCGTCGRKLVIDRNKHYVCLKCERMHPCLNNPGAGFRKINQERKERKEKSV